MIYMLIHAKTLQRNGGMVEPLNSCYMRVGVARAGRFWKPSSLEGCLFMHS